MFNNIGEKIKVVAQFITWLGIIASVLICLVLASTGGDESIGLGCVFLIVGCIGSWLSSLLLYGFGQLIENSDIIASKYNSSRLSEADENAYKNDPDYKSTKKDERTFEQIVESSNLSNEQKKQINDLKEWLDGDLIDVTDCCKRIRQIASNQPEEIITKIISKL